MSVQTWLLVRHGETEWNATSRMQGQLDSPLTARGREQVATVADLLARLGVDEVFASPLGRVRETVAILGTRVATPVHYDDRLKEWSAGDWSGELYADIGGKWPDEWRAWNADRVGVRSPRGENFLDLVDRGRAFFADVAPSGRCVAIVAHGFLNRALAAILLDTPPTTMLDISQPNDTVIRVSMRETTLADYFTDGLGPFEGLPLAPMRG